MMIYEANTHSDTGQFYNLTMVHKMCRGNQEAVLKMVKVFISQMSQSIEVITVASQKSDIEKIKNEIHKVKPTLTYYGTAKIEKELLALENLLAGAFTRKEIEMNINTLNTTRIQTIAKMKIDFSLSNH